MNGKQVDENPDFLQVIHRRLKIGRRPVRPLFANRERAVPAFRKYSYAVHDITGCIACNVNISNVVMGDK